VSKIEELRARLAAAERVCVLFGWTCAAGNSDRDKAVTQAWQEWHHAYGHVAPQPGDDEVMQLAARRDVIRNVTLMRLRKDRDDG
jgi:hypothetical protein